MSRWPAPSKLSARILIRFSASALGRLVLALMLICCRAVTPVQARDDGVWLACNYQGTLSNSLRAAVGIHDEAVAGEDFYFYDKSRNQVSNLNEETRQLEHEKRWEITNGQLSTLNFNPPIAWRIAIDRVSLKYQYFLEITFPKGNTMTVQREGSCRSGVAPRTQRPAF